MSTVSCIVRSARDPWDRNAVISPNCPVFKAFRYARRVSKKTEENEGGFVCRRLCSLRSSVLRKNRLEQITQPSMTCLVAQLATRCSEVCQVTQFPIVIQSRDFMCHVEEAFPCLVVRFTPYFPDTKFRKRAKRKNRKNRDESIVIDRSKLSSKDTPPPLSALPVDPATEYQDWQPDGCEAKSETTVSRKSNNWGNCRGRDAFS